MNTCKTKKELAIEMGISHSTLQSYLNKRWYLELKKLDYEKQQKILSPNQLEYIKAKWG